MTQPQPTSSPEFRAALTRAQWAVIQTGLITSGLALFGVYVLATRINDLHLMSLYAPRWLPAGPLLVGLICGSGYILASWWFGVRVGLRMTAVIAVIQLGMFMACHYADFETLDLVYRDTGQSVSFFTYFHYTTRRLAADAASAAATQPSDTLGYAIRVAEVLCFAVGGLLSAFTLVGRPKCPHCGGLVRRRTVAQVAESGNFRKRMEEHARIADLRAFDDEIARHAADGRPGTVLEITRCEVCGFGTIDEADPAKRDEERWRIPVGGDFARAIFERSVKPAAAVVTAGGFPVHAPGDATSRP